MQLETKNLGLEVTTQICSLTTSLLVNKYL